VSWPETLRIIVRARREGVVLFAKDNGRLGMKAAQRPSDELLAVLKEHKAEILALLPPLVSPPTPSPVEKARLLVERLRDLGFRPYLDGQGALLIADEIGRRRDVTRFTRIATVFGAIVAGLAGDPGLLDSMTEERS
jgi:hypothetical protein